MQEDANKDVELDINGSESSTDKEEKSLDDMNEEELREFAKREREAKERAVQHMRDQAKKRKSIEESVLSSQDTEDKEDEQSKSVDNIREETRRIIQEEHRAARISEYSTGSTDWLKSQSWAEEINKSDTLYGEFSNELKRIAEKKDVHSQAEFRKLMRLAAVTITGKPDALLEQSAEEEVKNDKQHSSGYRPSQVSNVQTYSSFSEADRKIIARINERRAKQNLPPLKPSEILRK